MSVSDKPMPLIAISLFLTFAPGLQADNLQIPGHIETSSQLIMPQRGLSIERVLEQFGEPERRIPAVGQPPITEWDYGDFRVYFEYRSVLHSVNLTTLITPKQ